VKAPLKRFVIDLLWWFVILFLIVSVLASNGCAVYPGKVQNKPTRERTIRWCETSYGERQCWDVPEHEARRAVEVLRGDP
jgi:hypothetical protein